MPRFSPAIERANAILRAHGTPFRLREGHDSRALHTTESLKAQRLDPSEPLRPMATHKQGFHQKREVVSLLRRAGFGGIAPEELSTELKGMVNRKKQALVAAGQSRRRIPTTDAIETWLDQVMEEDPLWGWVFALVATYGLRPHEVWHIGTLPDEHGLINAACPTTCATPTPSAPDKAPPGAMRMWRR